MSLRKGTPSARRRSTSVRVLDEDLRLLVGDFRRATAEAREPDNAMETSPLREKMIGLFLQVNKILGGRLRSLYGESDGPQMGHTTDSR